MEPQSQEKLTGQSPSPDSALGTMPELTPEDEENHFLMENDQEEEKSEDIVSASMQFALAANGVNGKRESNSIKVEHIKEKSASPFKDKSKEKSPKIKASKTKPSKERASPVKETQAEISAGSSKENSPVKMYQIASLQPGKENDNSKDNGNVDDPKEDKVIQEKTPNVSKELSPQSLLKEHIDLPAETETSPQQTQKEQSPEPTQPTVQETQQLVPEAQSLQPETILKESPPSRKRPLDDSETETCEAEETKDCVETVNPVAFPSTVSLLPTREGSEVYVVGTAHFSHQSQNDVRQTIQRVRPDVLVLELCNSRTAVLTLDEETILSESQDLDWRKVVRVMKQNGRVQGVLYLLLLSVSSHLTKQLGMAPGGEFRAAVDEVKKVVPHCIIHLGDRPINITLARALASLSVWHKLKLMWHILTSNEPISKEEVEKCKEKDFIEEMLEEITGEFPGISEVFVRERDTYLTMELQRAARPTKYNGFQPRTVVGVVGMGHMPGIVEKWSSVTAEDVAAIIRIPPSSTSDIIIKYTFKIGVYSLIGFCAYKCLPKTAKSSVSAFLENSVSKITTYFGK